MKRIFFIACCVTSIAAADPEPSVAVVKVAGDAAARGPKDKSYAPIAAGATLADGSRLRAGEGGEIVIRYQDGSESTIRARSEVIVRATRSEENEPNGIILFFGRVWAEVTKATGGETRFEVRSANAVAGVRGTKFEVGVADDGSARVIVREGVVAVGGDPEGARSPITAGSEIETGAEGRLLDKRPAALEPGWDKWFEDRGHAFEKDALKLARRLDQRISERRAEIDRAHGVELERSVRASFGLLAHWREVAERTGLEGREEIARLQERASKSEGAFETQVERARERARHIREDRQHDKEKEHERERRRR